MKNTCEKPKKVNETIDIGVSVDGSIVLGTRKDGDNIKEPYEPPEMVIKTIDDFNQNLNSWVIPQ